MPICPSCQQPRDYYRTVYGGAFCRYCGTRMPNDAQTTTTERRLEALEAASAAQANALIKIEDQLKKHLQTEAEHAVERRIADAHAARHTYSSLSAISNRDLVSEMQRRLV